MNLDIAVGFGPRTGVYVTATQRAIGQYGVAACPIRCNQAPTCRVDIELRVETRGDVANIAVELKKSH
jgi:hypothetical protein